MWLPNVLKTIRLRIRRRSQAHRALRRQLTVESLESRDVPTYAVTDLGLLPGCTSGYAEAVNASGEVAGYDLDSNGQTHAFLWNNGMLTDLGMLGGDGSIAYGINDVGQVVGTAGTTELDSYGNPINHAFLWQNGVMTDLGTLSDAYGSAAYDVNNSGQVVGASQFDWGEQAFIWQSGTTTAIATWGGSTSATAINDAGEVVGHTGTDSDSGAFAWQNGSFIGLDMSYWDQVNYPGPFSRSSATAVNNSGLVAGWGARPYIPGEELTPLPGSAAIWQNGAVSQLVAWGFGAFDSYPTGINNASQVVGQAGSITDPSYHAFLWQNGVLTDLTTQLPTAYSGVQVNAINDAGQIAGTANGRPVLLTPAPSLVIDSVTLTEGNSGTVNATFTVRLSGNPSSSVTVQYATANGSATAGSDYQAVSGTLTFPPGETTKTITVPVIGDRLAEPNETFFVNLSQAVNADIAAGQGTGTILDDEHRISIGDVTRFEGKKGQATLFMFTVTLSAAYDQPVTVSYKTTDGTATTSDNDYVAQTGTLTFNPGETTKTITIVVNGDSKREADETFYLDLFGNSSNALFTKNRGVGTILNDD